MKRLIFLMLIIVGVVFALPYLEAWQAGSRDARNEQQAQQERMAIITVQSEVMATLGSAAQSACTRTREGSDESADDCVPETTRDP